MKLCTACKGVGHFNDVDCPTCGGEGILASPTTFVRSNPKKKSFTEHEASKKVKFDKKNAIRGGY